MDVISRHGQRGVPADGISLFSSSKRAGVALGVTPLRF
jgi:hypothetical protein